MVIYWEDRYATLSDDRDDCITSGEPKEVFPFRLLDPAGKLACDSHMTVLKQGFFAKDTALWLAQLDDRIDYFYINPSMATESLERVTDVWTDPARQDVDKHPLAGATLLVDIPFFPSSKDQTVEANLKVLGDITARNPGKTAIPMTELRYHIKIRGRDHGVILMQHPMAPTTTEGQQPHWAVCVRCKMYRDRLEEWRRSLGSASEGWIGISHGCVGYGMLGTLPPNPDPRSMFLRQRSSNTWYKEVPTERHSD